MSPAGSYTLASVNGRDVPAVWHEVTAGNGDVIQSVWVDGRVEFCPEGSYRISLESALLVDGRTDPLGRICSKGRWLRAGDGHIELHSEDGAAGRWQASEDLSVLVARSRDQSARAIFVFLRD